MAKYGGLVMTLDSSDTVIIQMSEFQQTFDLAKLIGFPPGFMGHEREGLLAKAERLGCAVEFRDVASMNPALISVIFEEDSVGGLSVKAEIKAYLPTENPQPIELDPDKCTISM